MNSITIAGTVGNAELKFLQSGDPILTFSVADSEGRDKPTIWWNCSLFGKRAESLAPFVAKGGKVTVAGKVSQREFTDKNGQERKSMDVRVTDVMLQGSKEQSEEQPRRAAAPAPSPKGFDDMDDDLPF
jgi:single-strand DNA-binding protein